MASEPQRREVRRTHLDASAVPVERALLARADAIESRIVTSHNVEWTTDVQAVRDAVTKAAEDEGRNAVARIVAGEFRALAEELHWW